MVQQPIMVQQPAYMAQQARSNTGLCECDCTWWGFCCLSTWFFSIGSLVIDFKINGTGSCVGWFLFFVGIGYRVAFLLYVFGLIFWVEYYDDWVDCRDKWSHNYDPWYCSSLPNYFAMMISGVI